LLADQTFLFKHLLKEVALKHGLTVVCMAKPLAHTPGSSMHIHQSLVEMGSGRNVFSDEAGQPTAMFRHFIGGLQAGLAEFTALFAPNVNSYQRLCHPYASPNNACWSHDNRAAGLRIPASSPVARRVENRLPGADANPYLAIAASLAPACMESSMNWNRARRSRANSKCRTIFRCRAPCTLRSSV